MRETKELVVISGKGGTGKTSVVASFAALARRPVLTDCDVDAADLHLVLAPADTRTTPFIGGVAADVNRQACSGCGRCEGACRSKAITVGRSAGNGAYVAAVDLTRCVGCGVCAFVCPESAIALREEQCGEWFVSRTRFGPMAHARLRAGRGNSGKLVTTVRKASGTIANETGGELILSDGPPGIGCPVVASLTGADMALVVTEPSESGLHDLRRVASLAAQLRVPIAVCVNKWDVCLESSTALEEWCISSEVPILGRIPYDRSVTKAQIHRMSVIEYGDSPAAAAIRDTWEETAALL